MAEAFTMKWLESRRALHAAEDRYAAAVERGFKAWFERAAAERGELDAYIACPEAFEHRLVPYP